MTTGQIDLGSLKILLVHEWLYTWAGAERVLEQLVQLLPHADILAGIVAPEMRTHHAIARRARESWVGRIPGARRHHRWFLPAHALAFSMYDTTGYDLVISLSHAFEKAVRARNGAVHVSYCLTPPRYLWDMGPAHDQHATPWQRLALRIARRPLRAMDRLLAKRVDHFVCLSNVVADRVARAYGRESAVVYPPVARKPGVPGGGPRQDFLLTLGRLVAYKRVDLAVRAAERLGMRLVVAGDGPERDRLRRMAGPHTEFAGPVSEQEASNLLESCAAFVFCAEEDFGIAPLEANAHGAPVVAYQRGATGETMRDGITGVLFPTQTVDALTDAISGCLATTWNADALRANAERFSPERFREGMRQQLVNAISRGAS